MTEATEQAQESARYAREGDPVAHLCTDNALKLWRGQQEQDRGNK